MALVDFHDVSHSGNDRLLPSVFTAGIFSDNSSETAAPGTEGRWKYRASVLFIVVASVALWGGIFEAVRALV